jgi:hypothetical protein
MHRFFGRLKEDESHPIAHGNSDKLAARFTFPELRRFPDGLIELLDNFALLDNQQL